MATAKRIRARRTQKPALVWYVLVPAVLAALVIFSFILGLQRFADLPPNAAIKECVTPYRIPADSKSKDVSADLSAVLAEQLKDYKAELGRLDANIRLQALLVAITVLLIIRRADSLNLFGNSIPLSWLHFFAPVLMMYLWLSFGFILHDLIWSRVRALQIIGAIHGPALEYQKALFHDAGFIDGWFITFIGRSCAGITHGLAGVTSTFLVVVLGTLTSAAHASMLAIVWIGHCRYLRESPAWVRHGSYALPIALLAILLLSHYQFAYGGENGNWLQLYVAVATIPFMLLLLWLAAITDSTPHPDTT